MQPLLNATILLKKMAGKGGWTYAEIPLLPKHTKGVFGWTKVKGSIDGYEINCYHLMSMGNKKYFLPINAKIRKAINKHEGDYVKIILEPDNNPLLLPQELVLCLKDEPIAHTNFMNYTQSQQKEFVNWINDAKRIETKSSRIAKTVIAAFNNLKFIDK
jgi:uncharacterized protein YdeI (YjbR/CyaY-like superfamily)